MAIYHWEAQIFTKSKGHSAIAAAAYRAGERLQDNASRQTHNYEPLRSRVAYSRIMVPDGAADWLSDRAHLWNHVHRHESKREDSQLAREINIALPHELTLEQNIALMDGYIRAEFTCRGMVADVNIHQPDASKGQDARHWHAHVLLPLRQATANGLHNVKTREWNALFRAALDERRRAWEEHCNAALALHGHAARVDRRTLAAQRAHATRTGELVEAIQLHRIPQHSMTPRQVAQARKVIEQTRRTGAAKPELPPAVQRNAAILENNRHAAWKRQFASDAHPREGPPLTSIIPSLPAEPSIQPRSIFHVSQQDIAFALYRMGALTLPQLQRSLEAVAFEQASRHAVEALSSLKKRLSPSRSPAAQHARSNRPGPRRRRSQST